jgi:hypothetical protein
VPVAPTDVEQSAAGNATAEMPAPPADSPEEPAAEIEPPSEAETPADEHGSNA